MRDYHQSKFWWIPSNPFDAWALPPARLSFVYLHSSQYSHPQTISDTIVSYCLLIYSFIGFVCRTIDSATLSIPIFQTHLPLYTPVFIQQKLRPFHRFQKLLVSYNTLTQIYIESVGLQESLGDVPDERTTQ